MSPKLLLIDDEPSFRVSMSRYLSHSGFTVRDAGTLQGARAALAGDHYDAMLLDLQLPDGNGMDWIAEIRRQYRDLILVVITGCSEIPVAVEAMRRGADHFVAKPIEPAEVTAYLQRALDAGPRLRASAPRARKSGSFFFGTSTAARELETMAEIAASSDAVVLIMGETGAGKGMLAKWIHEQSTRRAKPFVEVNCSALRGELLANEMFGHSRGAFTSAADTQEGLLDAADGGTLFLDEVGDMDPGIQAQLLKTIEEKRYRRLGDVKPRRSDFRLICATNHSLQQAVAAGRFRSDFFYRINVLSIAVPALRERINDLADFISELTSVPVERSALDLLERHPWPGNVRELRNVLERAALVSRGQTIAPWHLELEAAAGRRSEDPDVLEVLQRHGGNKERAAREMGISRATLYRRLSDLKRPVSQPSQ